MTWATKLPGGRIVGRQSTKRLATVHRDRVLGFWIGRIVKVKK